MSPVASAPRLLNDGIRSSPRNQKSVLPSEHGNSPGLKSPHSMIKESSIENYMYVVSDI